ncbi:MAG: hypothetical protein WD894_17190 [Pirellulales bacterium]
MEAIGPAESALRILGAGPAARRRAQFQPTYLMRWLAVFLIVALFSCGAWLMVRRLTGSFASPLEGHALVAVAGLAILWAAGGRLMWRHATDAQKPSWRGRALEWTPTVALVLIATSAVLPGSSLPAVVLFWAMIATEEIGAVLIGRQPISARSSAVAPQSLFPSKTKPRTEAKEFPEIEDVSLPSELRQQQTRNRTPNGSEAIHGTLRAVFSVGQRVAIEHIVFCPMLDRVPTISAVVLDELECSARATHIYRYGARLEVKLREPCDEPVEVVMQYDVHE